MLYIERAWSGLTIPNLVDAPGSGAVPSHSLAAPHPPRNIAIKWLSYDRGGTARMATLDRPALSSLTSLDTLETSGIGSQNLAETFRHSGWARRRKLVWQALNYSGATPSQRSAFGSCGAYCRVLVSITDPEDVRLAATCCHNRFCLPCAQTRSHTIAANVLPHVQRGQCRFITLTLRHSEDRLATQIDRLYQCFKLLRCDPLWRETQTGGVAFLEIKRSSAGHWHPHFHVISQGSYIDVRELSAAWRQITGDSFIVDIRYVRDEGQVLRYVTKYASKPFDSTLFESSAVLIDAMTALKGRRMALAYGSWKGLQMTEKPDPQHWRDLGSLEEMLYEAARGDEQARQYIRRVCGDKADVMIGMARRLLPGAPARPHPPPSDAQLWLLEPPTAYERFVNSELGTD